MFSCRCLRCHWLGRSRFHECRQRQAFLCIPLRHRGQWIAPLSTKAHRLRPGAFHSPAFQRPRLEIEHAKHVACSDRAANSNRDAELATLLDQLSVYLLIRFMAGAPGTPPPFELWRENKSPRHHGTKA